MFEVDKKGIRIFGTSLWLDAKRKAPLSFISHAHADHIKNHQKIIATPETIIFYQYRCKQIEHGFDSFSYYLKKEGFEAATLTQSSQISLF